MEVTRHFTATTMIVHGRSVLLHMHKKLKKWLPVGGHIDRDELPLVAARREVLEEAGLEVEFFCEGELQRFSDVQELPRPVYLMLQDINPYHQHIDSLFFARSNTREIPSSAEAFETLRWLTIEEIEKMSDMPDDVIFLAKQAITRIGWDDDS